MRIEHLVQDAVVTLDHEHVPITRGVVSVRTSRGSENLLLKEKQNMVSRCLTSEMSRPRPQFGHRSGVVRGG